jgi:hypothetical protein
MIASIDATSAGFAAGVAGVSIVIGCGVGVGLGEGFDFSCAPVVTAPAKMLNVIKAEIVALFSFMRTPRKLFIVTLASYLVFALVNVKTIYGNNKLEW